LLNEERFPLIRHSYVEETKEEMKNGVNDMFDLMLDNKHPANKTS